jgi:hypothetical protein
MAAIFNGLAKNLWRLKTAELSWGAADAEANAAPVEASRKWRRFIPYRINQRALTRFGAPHKTAITAFLHSSSRARCRITLDCLQ